MVIGLNAPGEPSDARREGAALTTERKNNMHAMASYHRLPPTPSGEHYADQFFR
jgi:hypothetical protein